jgi:hypothetical protein
MSVLSYFWDSQNHLSNAAFGFEIVAAAVEVIVGIAVVATFHNEWGEKKRKRLEFLFEVAFLGAALIALVAIVSNRRIETLREKGEQASATEIKNLRDEAQAAAKSAGMAANNASIEAKVASNVVRRAEEINELGRHLTAQQKATIIDALKDAPKDKSISFECAQGDPEVLTFTRELVAVLRESGFKAGEEHNNLGGPRNPGLTYLVPSTNPPPSEAVFISRAFAEAGINNPSFLKVNTNFYWFTIWVGEKPN